MWELRGGGARGGEEDGEDGSEVRGGCEDGAVEGGEDEAVDDPGHHHGAAVDLRRAADGARGDVRSQGVEGMAGLFAAAGVAVGGHLPAGCP